MELLDERIIVSGVQNALFVPFGKGANVHKNRPTHGIAFNVGCDLTYRFAGGEALRCGVGECIYLPRGSFYTVDKYETMADSTVGTYAINFQILSEKEFSPRIFRIKGADEIFSSFARAESAWRKRQSDYLEECLMSLYRILGLMRRERDKYSPKKRALDSLTPALEYINDNYTRGGISLSDLAALCGVSEVYLRRLFQSAFSVSPAVYMRNMRIKYSKQLLRSGECSVTDAAMLSGFGDTSYFSREFKKSEGISPLEYVLKHSD